MQINRLTCFWNLLGRSVDRLVGSPPDHSTYNFAVRIKTIIGTKAIYANIDAGNVLKHHEEEIDGRWRTHDEEEALRSLASWWTSCRYNQCVQSCRQLSCVHGHSESRPSVLLAFIRTYHQYSLTNYKKSTFTLQVLSLTFYCLILKYILIWWFFCADSISSMYVDAILKLKSDAWAILWIHVNFVAEFEAMRQHELV